GEVPGPKPKDGSGEEAATTRDEPPANTPVDHAPAARVARADHEVGAVLADRRDELGQGCRIVGPVRVHLHDDGRAALQRHTEAVEVGAPEALLGGTVPDLDACLARREVVC